MKKQSFPAHPEVPISKAIRAGDFVFTSAYGPWLFDPKRAIFDPAGKIVDDGSGKSEMPLSASRRSTPQRVTGNCSHRHGTLRMGTDPAKSVLDRYCLVHRFLESTHIIWPRQFSTSMCERRGGG